MISGIFLNENFLFKKEYYDTDIDYLDKRRIQIAFNIIRQSISFILNQAQILYKDSPSIYELIESQLKQSLKIVEDIANKIEMMALREKEKDRKLKYLFNWNKIPGPDESKLQFVYDLESLEDMHYLYSIKKISKSKDKSKISFQLVIDDETLIEDFGHDIIDISISLPDKIYEKNVDKEASIRISHSNGKIVDIPLVIHEDMGTKYVFLKRSDKPKKIKK